MVEPEKEEHKALREPIKKTFGGSLATRSPFERLAMLQCNADALVKNWRGKDDGTLVRKIFGPPNRQRS